MWQAVTVSAVWHTGMLPFVTINTIDSTVVGIGLSQSIDFDFVTGATELCRDIASRFNFQWLMGSVALGTLPCFLPGTVWLMTIQTARDFFMPTVTAIAEKFPMATRFCFHLLPDFKMAGETFFSGRLERVTQRS